MGTPMLNTLVTAQRLTQAGMDREQAEALTMAINEGLVNIAATKEGLQAAELSLVDEIKAMGQALRGEIKAMGQSLREEIIKTNYAMKISIIQWMVVLLLGQTAVILAVLALLLKH